MFASTKVYTFSRYVEYNLILFILWGGGRNQLREENFTLIRKRRGKREFNPKVQSSGG